jgi:hypothetical protein
MTHSRSSRRVAIWKIVAAMLGFLTLGIVLLVASARIQPAESVSAADQAARSASSMATLLQLIGTLACAAALICVGWLGYRYYLSIPAWKRNKGLPRRR